MQRGCSQVVLGGDSAAEDRRGWKSFECLCSFLYAGL